MRIFLLLGAIQLSTLLYPQSYSKAIAEASRRITEQMQVQKLPGVAVAVSIRDEIVWSEGLGLADLENGVPVDPERSLFRIGSISKTLTAASLAVLYEQKLIDLDAEVQTYCSDFPYKDHPITVRQVGGHLAGIRHYRGVEFLSAKRYPDIRTSLRIFQDDSLLFVPGTKYSYSSYGWNLLSYVVEAVAKTEFLKYMKNAVFQPLLMAHSQADFPEEITPGRVRFYQQSDRKLVNCPFVDNSYKWAGGGFLSTAHDLIQFGEAHLYHRLVSKETFEQFSNSQKLNDGTSTGYGIGWRIGTDKFENRWMGHSGGSVGGVSMFRLYPEYEMVIVVLTNTSHANIGNLTSEIANDFIVNQ